MSLRRENNQISDQKPFISKSSLFHRVQSSCDPGSDGGPASWVCVRCVVIADHPLPPVEEAPRNSQVWLIKLQTQIQSTVGRSSGCGRNHLRHRCCSCKETARAQSEACPWEAGLGTGRGKGAEVGKPGLARSLHQALPLAIRMEGNTADNQVTLDSSKLFFKGQVEEPRGKSRVGSNSSFSPHLLRKHVNGNHSQTKL